MKTSHWNHKGFTLAEMAIVVLIGSIMLTMGIKVLTVTMQNTAITETKARQERIRTALIGFLRTNGRLPCPDIAATPTGAAPGVCSANSAAGYGVVPWTTLGISRNDALDGWGNFFTYRVANHNPGTVVKNWTTIPASATTPYIVGELSHPSTALTIQELNAAGAALIPTTAQAVVIILSHGKNGFGAKSSKGTNIANPPAPNAGEVINNTAGTATFVKRPYTDSPTAFNGPFDDIVDFMTPQDLLQPLINDGTQPDTAEGNTRAKQERIKTALIGFLRTNRRLPCPDITTPPTGIAPAACSASAAAGYGVVPWTTLGISRNDVLDGWGNYLTYKVANHLPAAVVKNWTTTDTATSYNIGELSNPSTAFTINELNAAGAAFTAPPPTTQAVVVILSQGKNGFGSINASGAANANPPAANAGEVTNNTAATTTFVRRPYTDLATAFNGPFDDIVEFMIPQDLLQPLINDGTWQQTAESDTVTKQEQIRTALTGYLRTHGHLPCPNSTAPWDGAEDRPNNNAGGNPTTTCLNNAGRGVIPWQALGLSQNTVRDGWGNYFTYRVVNLNTNAQVPFTTPPGPVPPLYQKRNRNWTIKEGTGAFDIDSLTDATISPGYQALRMERGAGAAESRTTVAVILSHGKNGLGARNITGALNTLPPAATDERTNATTGSTTFVHRPVANNPNDAGTNAFFDDFISYLTPQDLLQPLVDEKTIKTCKSYCPAGTCPAGGTCTPTINISIGAPNPTCTCIPGGTLP
jgi:prepilin-type N-terminal cleavage/methylation domain-containing protein